MDGTGISQDPYPYHISRTKQARIDVWRTEVAALNSPLPPSSTTTTRSSAASTSSSSSSTAKTSTSSPRSIFSARILSSPPSHGRHLWHRIKSRFSRNPRPLEASATEMYASYRMTVDAPPLGASNSTTIGRIHYHPYPHNQDMAAEDFTDLDDEGANGLLQKQERLERAARLLDHGVVLHAMAD